MMRRTAPLLCLAALVALSAPACADDEIDCTAGIAMLQAEIAKGPPEPASAKLNKALAKAQREQKEREFDECVEAIDDGKEALDKAEKKGKPPQ